MEIVFLVYDSRSGSTVISRELQKRTRNWTVTQEIGFSALLRKIDSDLAVAEWIAVRSNLIKSPEFINFKGDLKKLNYPRLQKTVLGSDFLSLAIKDHLMKSNGSIPPEGVVVKNGSHMKHIKKLCGHNVHNYKFLYIFRDPRAVIRSKLTTQRPYYPDEKMAWGGVFLAALRWKLYSRAAISAKNDSKPIHFIMYEQFVESSECVVRNVLDYLGETAFELDATGNTYAIPEAEKSIHSLVQKSEIVRSRMNTWESELNPHEIAVIETICGKEMRALGYSSISDFSIIKKCCAVTYAAIETAIKVIRRFLLRSSKAKKT